MAISYPHRLKLTRQAAGGTQDPATGAWVNQADPEVIYDGQAEAYEPNSGTIWQRLNEGLTEDTTAWRVYLPVRVRPALIRSLKPGDHAVVTFEDRSTRDFTVEGGDELALVVRLKEA